MREKYSATGFDYKMLNEPRPGMDVYAVRAFFSDQDSVERLKEDHPDEVVGVYADPAISPFPAYCGCKAIGTSRDVARLLGLSRLHKQNITGRGVRIAIVDSGVSKSIPVSGGWIPPGIKYEPGTANPDHGTMCAFDARISAPDADILDYALLRTKEKTLAGFLSDALAAFSDLTDLIQKKPGPLVVSNSWGLPDRRSDEPIGSPGNYSANLDHPFNQAVATLVGAGADVLFAAGNCGENCPSSVCGTSDIGPGKSIHGANSHPDVISVAAVTIRDNRLGYSSQGPGGLNKPKPDIAAYSHFEGSKVFPTKEGGDNGTSAACPVAAGVIAILRQKLSTRKIDPAAMKGVIQRTARDVNGGGWDTDLGYGIVDAGAAWDYLK